MEASSAIHKPAFQDELISQHVTFSDLPNKVHTTDEIEKHTTPSVGGTEAVTDHDDDDNERQEDFAFIDDDVASSDEEGKGYFQRNKTQRNLRESIRETQSERFFMRRNNSLENFICRSERNRRERASLDPRLLRDLAVHVSDVEARKVRFQLPVPAGNVHELEELDSHAKEDYYMTRGDFARMQDDFKMVLWKWENHAEGRIAFDDSVHGLRGLEEITKGVYISDFYSRGYATRVSGKFAHSKAVLLHLQEQQLTGVYLDWDACKEVATAHSQPDIEYALFMGQHDYEEALHAYDPHRITISSSFVPRAREHSRDRKSGHSREDPPRIKAKVVSPAGNGNKTNAMKKVLNAIAFWNK
jgi:hypothetical protein